MLATLGLVSILLLLYLVMAKKASPVVALIIVPVVTGLMAGLGFEAVDLITEGIKSIAPTGVMFIFAILFFGILTDAGTFRPIIQRLLKLAGNDPARVAVASALLAMIVHLDGSGAVTFLVTVPAFLPVYDQLKMKRSTLACIVALAAGTMNIVPWGGPTIRAATALDISVTELFNPMLIPVLIGLLSVLLLAYRLGSKERYVDVSEVTINTDETTSDLERPKLFWVNILLILLAVGTLISGVAPPHVIFMIAFVLALSINYPSIKEQSERVNAHAKAAMLMASILFAAGCFTGILKGSGMIEAMAEAAVTYIPNWVGGHLPVITGVLAMPASLLFDPDSFYFGVLPLLSSTSAHFGGNAIEIGRAAITGQMTTGFPVSPLTGATFLLIGLTGVDLGEHQRKTIPYAFGISLIILIMSLLVGAITF
ncbi:CitMHS family transporter [Mangrovimonas sp. DI 80]|uniref:CitMHS family transporter n=1 Tax=Mangrovimonas sp. DI 80 TaxID=1779330 RepID=UPI000975D12D|nr:citrate:proton symporter [Mangrovimonas sp. DI 80]OMP32836.1 citrate transporter [Mangrovimonas sp. DI 80]